MEYRYQNVEFIKSVVNRADFIYDGRPMVVFSGKSNVGKSSVINKLLSRKSAARVSSSPGKTVHINYFLIDGSMYFIDLPGYGFAKVSKTERDRWGRLMNEFFAFPDAFSLGVMIVDSRHKPTADDVVMADCFKSFGRQFVVVANKIDKLKKSETDGNLKMIADTLGLGDSTPLIPFSAEKGTNRELLLSTIESFL